jgi:hypothetical protein
LGLLSFIRCYSLIKLSGFDETKEIWAFLRWQELYLFMHQ